MELLEIENFISIKRASIKLNKINIFIGPQAKGKSLISKIIHFCKEVPFGIFETVVEEKSKREFDRELIRKFENIFPNYAWEKSDFKISYTSALYGVEISHQKNNSKSKLCIKYTEEITRALSAARRCYQKLSQPYDGEARSVLGRRNAVYREMRELIASNLSRFGGSKIEQVIYIPAGRSFFANLQKNVFSFLSTSIPIDYFLKEFGAIYEQTRDKGFRNFVDPQRPKSVSKLVNDLICGSYQSEKGQDWIITDHGRVNVSNSSSGQQEVLPMAMVLSNWPFANSSVYRRSFVIEEPEAHLFPIAQGQVASLIACAYNAHNRQGTFTITTHSPYILTAINNLIQAANASKQPNADKASINEVVPSDQAIEFEHISAYIVDKGTTKSILDEELKLIQADAVDVVSQYFSEKFEKLIELEIQASQVED
ncbi:AAA family ATPase [Pseudomonas sp. KNUC1026]|uniref:AAA family ATPase n=1 Tax=Pseudomonas sp. KNUC1026 TaxID=2893890 RepID=UPI001F34367B|nr:AAA family ATPase [Pseudomonas sp. KNUC1026]UFH49201.1 ATP-binding protein [Pseudomonas sp. KNUC1026]